VISTEALAPRLSAAGEAVRRPKVAQAHRNSDVVACRIPPPTRWAASCNGRLHEPRECHHGSPVFVELMAGSRRMASAAAKLGAWGVSFEIADDPREDAMSRETTRWLQGLPGACQVAGIWIGLVCASWSRARRNTTGKGWPGPLRDNDKYLWGLPSLSPRDAERVESGNAQVRWASRIFSWAARRSIPCVIENPASSRVWLTPQMQRLLMRYSSVDIHYCAFGMAWKKPTRLLFCNCDLGDLERFCCHASRGRCAFSGAPHQQLSGRSPTGPLWSAVASAYPPKMCAEIMARIIKRGTRPPCPRS
jgi:hypothetical protein